MVFRIIPQGMREVVARARAAVAPADAEERARRLAICRACPMFTTFLGERCTVCSCPIHKAVFQRAHCPDNPPRW